MDEQDIEAGAILFREGNPIAPLRFGVNEIQPGGTESRFRFTPLAKRG